MTKENIKVYKKEFLAELEEQVWRKEMNIAFDLSKIPDIEKLRDDRFQQLDELNGEFKKIDLADTTKVTRVKRKDLEKKIAAAEEFTLSCDETITAIKVNTSKEKEKVDQINARIKFAETYGSDQN
jgi:septal ring factor EnvC (AmiA/AmiB activator)